MAQGTRTATDFDLYADEDTRSVFEIDGPDADDLDDEVQVDGDDWMAQMLAGPTKSGWDY